MKQLSILHGSQCALTSQGIIDLDHNHQYQKHLLLILKQELLNKWDLKFRTHNSHIFVAMAP